MRILLPGGEKLAKTHADESNCSFPALLSKRGSIRTLLFFIFISSHFPFLYVPYRHVPKGEAGGHVPPQILADQKAPPAAAARRITTCPPRSLDFGTCLNIILLENTE